MKISIARMVFGNSEDSAFGTWLAQTAWTAARDARVNRLDHIEINLPDVATARNRAVVLAGELGADVLVMVDADTVPHPNFLFRALDILGHAERPTALLAPYLGAEGRPGLFDAMEDPEVLRAFGREEAFALAGVRPVAAGGLGCAAFTMSCFTATPSPWFSWRWRDVTQSQIAVGEDVVGCILLRRAGCDILCDFDAWAGHRKKLLLSKG